MRRSRTVLILMLVLCSVISVANLGDTSSNPYVTGYKCDCEWCGHEVIPVHDGSLLDVAASPYAAAVEKLVNAGIVDLDGPYFRPADALTRADAAIWIVRTFKLSPIFPMQVSEEVQKKFIYVDPLGVIDESFVVPSAKDTVGSYAEEFLEGLVKVRAIDVESDLLRPSAAITGAEFGLAVAKVLFGVDDPVDYASELISLVYVPSQLLELDRPLRRDEAAQILSNFVDNPRFSIVTFLATADIHGHIAPYKPSGAKYAVGAMEKMAYYVNSEREMQSALLLLDVGDAPYNTNVANLFEGEPVIKIMNMMGYDAMVLGNHDFDFPLNVMERNSRLATFPFLSANTLFKDEPLPFLLPYVIKEVAGMRIAIVGLTDDSSAWYTHPRNVEGITFEEQYTSAKRVLEEVRPQADLVIALAHLHSGNRILPQKVPGYDIIFEGGRDVVAFPENINGSWVISSGKHAELISKTNLNFFDGKIIGMNFAHVFLSENLPADPEVEELANSYIASLDQKLDTVIGRTEVDLDGERGTVRLKESNLANAIADSLRELTGSDFAIQNGGGVRASVKAGDLTIKDIYTVLPFDNLVVSVELTGRQVWEVLEHGVSAYPAAAGQFLQVSGLEYTFDASKPPYSRVQSVTSNGKPIELDRLYTMAANDFLTGGGDKFTMFLDMRRVIVTKSFLRDVFSEYIIKHGTIAPELEGRIVIINPVN